MLAGRQHGLVTRDQLLRHGLSSDAIWRRVRSGALVEALPGVYRIPGAPRTWHQSLLAACLWAGEGAAASHRSAAALWGLDGFPEEPLEVTTAKKKNKLAMRFRIHGLALPPGLVTGRWGIPVTSAARTLVDLSVGATSRDRMEQTLDEALRKGLVSLASLRKLVEEEARRGRRGLGLIWGLLNERDPGYQPPASELQRKVRNLLIAAGITDFVEEYVLRDEDGAFVARGDFGLVGDDVLVEAEGRANHSSKKDYNHDLERRNRVSSVGWVMVHITAHDVDVRPEEWLARLRKIIRAQRRLRGIRPDTPRTSRFPRS